MELEPNQTIYIKNINEKVKKDVLKKQLYMLFSQYGRVKQIVACKGIKLRGQVNKLRWTMDCFPDLVLICFAPSHFPFRHGLSSKI